MFVGVDAEGNDFGDLYGINEFAAVVKEVGRFAGKVYHKYCDMIARYYQLTVHLISIE